MTLSKMMMLFLSKFSFFPNIQHLLIIENYKTWIFREMIHHVLCDIKSILIYLRLKKHISILKIKNKSY